MCAVFEQQGSACRPGSAVKVIEDTFRQTHLVWTGFARSEILNWWIRKKAGRTARIPAERFAERHRGTGELVWQDMPAGNSIQAIVEPGIPGKSYAPLRVVTRPSTPEEAERFGHDRMPVVVGGGF